VRNVFVGVLVATGMALIAIMGREKSEDGALNLAGMLAPTIGMLPTTVGPSAPGACREGVAKCIPVSVLTDVENNVSALLILGLVGLVGALVYVVRTYGWGSAQLRRIVLPALLWLVSSVLWLFARELMFLHGHNLAAFFFFLLLAWVARINALDPPEGPTVMGLRPRDYQRGYQIISTAMIATIVLTGHLRHRDPARLAAQSVPSMVLRRRDPAARPVHRLLDAADRPLLAGRRAGMEPPEPRKPLP